jgi:TOMM system kinase/cyclase fusion protein
LRATLALCASLVRKHGGRVTTALGDQLLVYFGVPRADENATKRAGRAALAIAEAVRTENERLSAQGGHIDVRIGIHTGLLVAAQDASDPKGHSAVGETPRLAASLASSAAPGTVLVTADAERLLRADFDIESLGAQPVAGMAGQMRLFRLQKHRGDPTSNSGSTEKQARLVGRDHEVQMLLERWRRTVAGTGQSILITGEPGIGKTRLAFELCSRLAATVHSRLEGRCLPDSQNDALFPFVQIVESALGIDRQETPEANLARLETELSSYGLDLPESMPLVLDLLALPVRPPYFAPDVSPQRRMELQQGAMLSLFFAIAEKRPLLLLVEDLHWASPSAIGFLGRLLREAPEYPICVVMTARPEFVASFSTAGVLQLPLARLDADETRALASELVGGRSLSPGFIDTILSRTDGIPLFIEELTRLILESGAVKEAEGGLEVSTALPDAVMPGPLRALISARLDRLDRAKATAAVAAALGREFSVDVLSVASTLGPQAVEEDLETLTNAGLIMRRGRRKDAMATFKHALVRDAAYDSLPRLERQQVHGRIAEVIEERFPEISRTRPELLAHHFAAAHRALQAIPYAQRAAEQALNRCAYNEAIAIASKMLDWTPTLTKGDAVSARLVANGVLTQALMTTRGWADPQIKQIAEESTALLRELPPSNPNKLPILWSLYIYHHTASQRPAARKVAEEICAMAEELQDEGLRAVSAVVLGATFHAEGNMDGAGRALDKAIALYDVDRHRDHGVRFGIDTLVWAKALLAHIRWFEGDDARAFELVNESMTWARELAHVPSVALGLMYGAQVYQLVGDKAKVAAMTEEILSLSGKYGLPAYEGYAAILHAWTTGTEQPIEQILGVLGAMGCNLGLSYFSSLPADIFADRGDLGAAIAVIDRCLSLCEQNDEHHYEHFLHWRRAVYCNRMGPAKGDVQTSLNRAMEVAKRCGARRVEALALGDL